eukprot:267372_1
MVSVSSFSYSFHPDLHCHLPFFHRLNCPFCVNSLNWIGSMPSFFGYFRRYSSMPYCPSMQSIHSGCFFFKLVELETSFGSKYLNKPTFLFLCGIGEADGSIALSLRLGRGALTVLTGVFDLL